MEVDPQMSTTTSQITKEPLTYNFCSSFLGLLTRAYYSTQMKELYGRLIMVTDTIPTLRTLSRFYSLEFTLVLNRQNVIIPPLFPAPKFVVCSSKRRLSREPIQDKISVTESRNMSLLSLFLSLFYHIYLLLNPFLCVTISVLSALSSFNYVVHSPSPSFSERSAEVFDMISFSPRFLVLSQRESPSHKVALSVSCRVLLKSCDSSQLRSAITLQQTEQQIHNCKISIFPASFLCFCFDFFLSLKCL